MSGTLATIGRRLRKFGLGLLAVLAALALVGAVYQAIGQALDRRALTPPGRLLAVDGATMHLHCTGAGAPTVILEAGAFGFAQVWARVQPRLAERTRVCSYDRAGLGWSDDADAHDGVAAAARLHALLAAAGEPGPYVLVGHSLGGALIRIFAARHPDEVVGLGFIDPSHPDQLERLPPEARAAHERVTKALAVLAWLSHVGVMRLSNALGRLHAGLPDDDYRAACMFNSSAGHIAATAAEFAAWDATMPAVRANDTLGDRPVVVISASDPMEGMSQDILERGQQLHAEIAGLSTRGRHEIVAASRHMTLLTDPTHAQRVAELLAGVVAEAAAVRPPAAAPRSPP
jgi:pimeloyl-ACP methyl ester carboxylesterase